MQFTEIIFPASTESIDATRAFYDVLVVLLACCPGGDRLATGHHVIYSLQHPVASILTDTMSRAMCSLGKKWDGVTSFHSGKRFFRNTDGFV